MKTIAIVDDHALMRASLASLVSAAGNFQMVYEATHGKELMQFLAHNPAPDMVLLDISMPVMDGFETACFLCTEYPGIRILMISMLIQPTDILQLTRYGIRGYLPKDAEPAEFRTALNNIRTTGYHYNQWFNAGIRKNCRFAATDELSKQEYCFMQLACTELTYKQIAGEMKVSHRTIDSYRDAVFRKLQVSSRIGVVVYAIRHGFISLWEKT